MKLTDPSPRNFPTAGRFIAPLIAIAIAVLVYWSAVGAKLGLTVDGTTPLFITCLLLAGGLGVAAVLLAPVQRKTWGLLSVAGFALLALVTALSISWSIAPEHSWLEANRTFAYFGIFAAGVGLAHLAPNHWRSVLIGVQLGIFAVLVAAVLSKVFPGTLDKDFIEARLQQPIKYWNALGVLAAMNLVLALWQGTDRKTSGFSRSLAYPSVAIALLVILLSLSRGSLAALFIGLVVWLGLSSKRNHSFLVLAVGGGAGSLISFWALKNHNLTTDKLELALREPAGQRLGLLLAITLLAVWLLGLAIEQSTKVTDLAQRSRRQIGMVIGVAICVIALAGVVKVAASDRGLYGSVEHAAEKLTDTNSAVPGNEVGRLGDVGSFRARYWDQALNLYKVDKLHGLGAGTFIDAQPRVRKDFAVASQAHGYVVQTLSDLGLFGLAASLLLLATWTVSAALATGIKSLPTRRFDVGSVHDESYRNAMTVMVAAVVVSGVVSFVDWTWFIPGVMLPTLLLAGFVAGRGGSEARIGRTPISWSLLSPRVIAALVIAMFTAIGLISTLQPYRAFKAQDRVIAEIDSGNLQAARKDAEEALKLNPLSPQSHYLLGRIDALEGNVQSGRDRYTYVATKLQPAVPSSWEALGQFELLTGGQPRRALQAASVALKMSPTSHPANSLAIAASQAIDANIQAERERRKRAKARKATQ